MTKAVVIGGGTGAPATIKAFLSLGVKTDAVVAMADDGGSSGMLREHTGKVPPGDVRKCIVAMARNPQNPWVKAFSERFSYVNNHTLGNLMLLALESATHSFAEAVRLCERLLDAQGHVYPSTLESVVLIGRTRDGQSLEGQSTIGKSQTALAEVRLNPAAPRPNQEAVAALQEADFIALGPGSLFTSIIPSLLVPGILDAVRKSRACKIFICSLGDMQGETWGLTASEHVEALLDHGLRGTLDAVIAHCDSQDSSAQAGNITNAFQVVCPEVSREIHRSSSPPLNPVRSVIFTNEDAKRIRQNGVILVARDLRDPARPTWHDRARLAKALKEVMQTCRSLPR